ncbi:ABC transporter substrate-binding protein [Nocardioides zeae]|uniref:ABC transporter substrate-binding protein n=1 Tax=Nocardioides zeae TaxID=1457234 RepID=A0A6P0HLX7_9ACTN|nr:ABC transporter substrate-binding protein [Nocardioides zeae]NEN78635.1 ABC transporter substrate-binding protein [Nocardioides zeae]
MTVPTPRARRRALTGALAAALALPLAACGAGSGDDGDTDGTSGSSAALLPAAEGTTSYPLTLETWAGETVLEERPERIAVIGFSSNLDALEALDVTPVYALSDEDWEWRDDAYLAGIETVDTATRSDPINVEGIAASDPDLIIALNFLWEEADVERLSAIAPVLENPELVDGTQIDWREPQLRIGEVLDLTAAAETVVEEADEAIAAVAEAHPEFAGRTITIATDYPETGMDYYTVAGGTAEQVVANLGFAPHPAAQEFTEETHVSDELLGRLDGDVLVVGYFDDATREARESSPLFQAIPAVAEGRYAAVDGEDPAAGGNAIWVMRRGASALSLPWALKTIADVWLADVALE